MERPATISFTAFALALMLLMPVAHGAWAADAPGRCIRTLRAYGPAKASSIRLTTATRPGLAAPATARDSERTRGVLEDDGDEDDGLGEVRPALESHAVAPVKACPDDLRPSGSPSPRPPLRC